MLSREDLQRLIHRPASDQQVLSVYLDMSVNSDNKRTYGVFLSQQRSRLLATGGVAGQRPLRDALDLIDSWTDTGFDEANKGVALFLEAGSDYFEAYQFPVPVENRLEIGDRPVVGPLVRLMDENPRRLLVVIGKETMRMVAVDFGVPAAERELRPEAIDSAHDVQRGGWSQPNYQRRKAEETRHFFKDFARAVSDFARERACDDVVLLGTDENVQSFREFLPQELQAKIIFCDHAQNEETASELVARLQTRLAEHQETRKAQTLGILKERVQQRHFATAGFHETLEQLQEGKVQTLVVARQVERSGTQCTKCAFYLPRHDPKCPYCGGETRDSVDLVEVMMRMAAGQEAGVEFVAPQSLSEMHGVGALLRF